MNRDCIVTSRNLCDDMDSDFVNVPYQQHQYLYDRDPGPNICASDTSLIQRSSATVSAPNHSLKPNYPQGHPFGPAMNPLNPEAEAWLAALRTGEYPVVTVPVPAEPEELFCYCMQPDRGEHMIQCSNGEELCRKLWFHIACIGEPVPPKEVDWFCRDCKEKRIGKLQHHDPVTGSASREPTSLLYDCVTDSVLLSSTRASAQPDSQRGGCSTSRSPRKVSECPSAIPPPTPRTAPLDGGRLRKTRNSTSGDKPGTISQNSTSTTTNAKVTAYPTRSGSRIGGRKRCAHFQKPKAISWTKPEEDALISVMKLLVAYNSPSSSGEKRWKVASEKLKEEYGFERSANGVKMTWMRVCRERSGIDERLWRFNAGGSLSTGLQKKRREEKRRSN